MQKKTGEKKRVVWCAPLNVDVIEDGNEQVDYEDIGAEQVQGHHNRGHPPAPRAS